jgi:electron transfer flavoprotein alpha subunit
MNRILIIGEHDGHALSIATAKCVSCAKAIIGAGGDIDIAVFGDGIDGIAGEAAALGSVARVIAVNAAHLGAPVAANWAAEAVALAGGYSHVLGASTTLGRDLMPRIAALLGVNQVSDIMEVAGPYAFKRPIYAGNAIVDVACAEGHTVVATVRGELARGGRRRQRGGGAAGGQRSGHRAHALHRPRHRGR